jgi:hypothetical protein
MAMDLRREITWDAFASLQGHAGSKAVVAG